MSDHKQIWLEPICAENAYEGRQWCRDDVWGECGECGHYSVKYIRADLYDELERRIERALELLQSPSDAPYLRTSTLLALLRGDA